MATFMSPADIIFYSHHATIDMLHHLYYECHVGREMSDREKRSSAWAFQNCNGLNSESPISMYWTIQGQPVVEAHRYRRLERFFANVGHQYYHMVDSKDMRQHSYAYQMDHLVSNLVRNGLSCPAGQFRRLSEGNHTRLDDIYEHMQDKDQYQAEQESIEWFDEMYPKTKTVCQSDEETIEQLEMMECVYHDKALGGVEDYTSEFRSNFKLTGHPRCKELLLDLENGNKTLKVKNWKQSFESKPCK